MQLCSRRSSRTPSCHPDQKHYAKDMCRRCYRRLANARPNAVAARAKYARSPKGRATIARTRRRNDPDGSRMRARSRKSYEKNRERLLAPERVRKVNLRDKYGLTTQEFEEMLLAQGGLCAICGEADKGGRALAVDHCHESGKVRALLCHRCNPGLGFFRDDIDRLKKAIAYLEKHQPGPT